MIKLCVVTHVTHKFMYCVIHVYQICCIVRASEDAWHCSACLNNKGFTSKCSTKQRGSCLSCICINARSITPKCLVLFAYICCHKVDILAITKTFLFLMLTFTLSHMWCFPVITLSMVEKFSFLQVIPRVISDELLWLKICTSTGPVLFEVFYRPPTQGVNNLVSDSDKVNIFNHYFHSVFTQENLIL